MGSAEAMPPGLAELVAAAPAPTRADKLDELRAACAQLRDTELEKQNIEQRLTEVNQRLVNLRHETLPDLMDEAGVDHIGLPASGNLPPCDAKCEPYYRANIAADWAQERREAAFSALVQEEAEDLIKHTFTVQFGRGEEDAAHSFAELLKGEGFEYTVGMAVPWATLTAWVKERFQSDTPLSAAVLETIGATVGRVVKLKPRKEK